MDRDYEKEIIEDDVTRMVRQAFGVDEDTLLKDFLLAQTEIREDQIPPESGDDFERLLKKMKERNIHPSYLHETASALSNMLPADSSSQEKSAAVRKSKPRRLKTIVKMAVVAAVLTAMVLGMGITSRARKWYTYNVIERDVSGVDVTYNKATLLEQNDSLEETYKQIRDELNISSLELTYIPNGMMFKKLEKTNNRATMIFEYSGNIIYVIQKPGLNGSSYNLSSDEKPYRVIYNDLLDREISVLMNQLNDGKNEFQIQITDQDNYYMIQGIMDYDEFERIVKGIYLKR